jgi:hypothetical protein
MARDSTGKWVQRAGATGGGRTYRGQVPTNWYAAIAIIVVLGLVSVVFARYEHRNKSAAASSVQPAIGTTWYAGYQFNICGTPSPSPASNTATATSSGFFTAGSGVITIKPLKSAQAGANATFGKFVAAYPPMEVTSSKVRVPGGPVYTNGEACPKGTPDAGQKGIVQALSWSNALLTKEKPVQVSGEPGNLRFSQNQLVSIGFLPEGKAPPRPSGSVVIALLDAANSTSTSTTLPTGSTVVTTPTGSTVVPTPTLPTTTAPATTTPTTAATKAATTTPTTKPASSTTATTK